MDTKNKNILIKNELKRVFKSEIGTLKSIEKNIDDTYIEIIYLIMNCRGKIIFFGIGKSGHIAVKLAATFSSVGIPSFFVAASEAAHGDLGMIESEDLVICISNSGETAEVVNVVPFIKKKRASIISFTGKESSTLADLADFNLQIKVEGEADRLNLAPTNSSTAVLVVGDAIAMTIAYLRKFTRQDFYLNHPGGALGKELLSK